MAKRNGILFDCPHPSSADHAGLKEFSHPACCHLYLRDLWNYPNRYLSNRVNERGIHREALESASAGEAI